jgi:hypothetical protein
LGVCDKEVPVSTRRLNIAEIRERDPDLAERLETARNWRLRGLRGVDPRLGRYDFDARVVLLPVVGDGTPVGWRSATTIEPWTNGQSTFTVAVFPFVPRADGGIKRGKAVKRIRGRLGVGDNAPERAFEAAERVCEVLEETEAGS